MERRFEIRFDGGRVVTGAAVVYGDEADLPWGRERFNRGAFGEIGAVDAILNVQHSRSRPIARTGGGGLEFVDTAEALEFRADLPATRDADDTLALVKARVLRGASLEFFPTKESIEKRADGKDLITIEEADLVGLAIVDSPAYPESTISARAKEIDNKGGLWMREQGNTRRVWL